MVRTPLVIKHAYVYVCVRVYMFVPVCVVWPRRYAAVTAYADIYVLTGYHVNVTRHVSPHALLVSISLITLCPVS